MKGFPNQVADLEKIATAIGALASLVERGADAKDDGVFGPELVRAKVAGTGHKPRPVEDYIREQLRKKPSEQSFRTTARGLRELFRRLGLIDDSGRRVFFTEAGRRAARFAGRPLDAQQIQFWRTVVRNMVHDGGGRESHPYQVLLRLIARKPGITRAKCALALEARDDSPEELERIVALADSSEETICRTIGVTESNWDNAKKVLPKFAEQLGDVVRTGQSYVLADAPGTADPGETEPPRRMPRGSAGSRPPRRARKVTPDSIGRAGTAENFDEVEVPPEIDPAAVQDAIKQRLDRLRRHNLIVQSLARRLAKAGATLYEDPFDALGVFRDASVLAEIKTLDGSSADERDRVQEALGQLLYYEAFLTAPILGGAVPAKIACFEHKISVEHCKWLNGAGIGTIWALGKDRFGGDGLAHGILGAYLEEFQ